MLVLEGELKSISIYGAPYFDSKLYKFTPKSSYGSKYPKYKEMDCFGEDLRTLSLDSLKKMSIH